MLITHDFSYIRQDDKKLVDNGYGKIGVYSLVLDVHFSEEQKAENVRTHGILSAEEWLARGEAYRLGFHLLLLPVLRKIHENNYLYQFDYATDIGNDRDRYSDGDYDLFFYSNKGWNNRDYFDHVSLSVNEKKSTEQNEIIFSKVLAVLAEADIPCGSCRVQYHACLDDVAIAKDADIAFDRLEKMGFVQYCTMNGKFKRLDGSQSSTYGFFKKSSRNRYYPIEAKVVLLQTL